MRNEKHFRRHAILPPTPSMPIEVTMAIVRTPAHVRHPRVTLPRPVPTLWAPTPGCMDVTSADRALARYVVSRADGQTVQPATDTTVAAQVIHDPGDLREPFTIVRGFGYALNWAPVIAVLIAALHLL